MKSVGLVSPFISLLFFYFFIVVKIEQGKSVCVFLFGDDKKQWQVKLLKKEKHNS